jgi:hypothetical protein
LRLRGVLERIGAYDLVASVAPIQLALRLLVPAGSLLLDLPEMAAVLGPFDAGRLVFPWRHPDPEVEALQAAVLAAVTAGECEGRSRAKIFDAVWHLAGLRSRHDWADPTEVVGGVPHLLEPWFCCAEPPAVRLGVPAAGLI